MVSLKNVQRYVEVDWPSPVEYGSPASKKALGYDGWASAGNFLGDATVAMVEWAP